MAAIFDLLSSDIKVQDRVWERFKQEMTNSIVAALFDPDVRRKLLADVARRQTVDKAGMLSTLPVQPYRFTYPTGSVHKFPKLGTLAGRRSIIILNQGTANAYLGVKETMTLADPGEVITLVPGQPIPLPVGDDVQLYLLPDASTAALIESWEMR